MRATEQHVVVIGGGLSGLVVAWRLLERARPAGLDLKITLIEREDRPGGKLLTERIDGYTVDHGPDVFLARKPWAVDLCRDLGLGDALRPTNRDPAGSFIKHHGRLVPLPAGMSGLVPGRIGPLLRTPLLSLSGKLRLACEPFVGRRSARGEDVGDEALGAFIRRRFGREMHERLIGPLLGGIYGGDVDSLSLRATFPQFETLEREYGSLVRAMIKRRRDRKPGPAFMTLDGGMGRLPGVLAERLTASGETAFDTSGKASGVRIVTGTEVRRIRPRRETGYAVECRPADAHDVDAHDVDAIDANTIAADVVVCTAPAYSAASLVERDRPELAAVLDGIPYNSTVIATLAFAREDVPHPMDGYGYLVPAAERDPVRACTFSSSKIPGRAPEKGVLLRLFFGRSADDPLLTADDETVYRTAAREIEQTLGVTAEPAFRRIKRWMNAQPAYTLGHPERLQAIDRLLAGTPGLFLTGSAYRGVGIPDCINQAELTATDIVTYLA